jgi:hypothetical protein
MQWSWPFHRWVTEARQCHQFPAVIVLVSVRATSYSGSRTQKTSLQCLLLYVFKLVWDWHDMNLIISKCTTQGPLVHSPCCETTYHLVLTLLSLPEKFLYLWSRPFLFPFSHTPGHESTSLVSISIDFPLLDVSLNGVLKYVTFCVWCGLFDTEFSRFLYITDCGCTLSHSHS